MLQKFSYQGGTPGADVEEYVLYDSIAMNNAKGQIRFERLYIDLVHDQSGDLIVRKTSDGGLTYKQISIESGVMPDPTESSKFVIYLGALKDAKVVWKNGGVAQNTFLPDVGEAPDGVT